MAQRARPVAAGAAHQQGLVHGRDRRDTEVGLRQRVRRRVHPGHGEVPGTVRRPVQHTIRENQLENVRFARKKKTNRLARAFFNLPSCRNSRAGVDFVFGAKPPIKVFRFSNPDRPVNSPLNDLLRLTNVRRIIRQISTLGSHGFSTCCSPNRLLKTLRFISPHTVLHYRALRF